MILYIHVYYKCNLKKRINARCESVIYKHILLLLCTVRRNHIIVNTFIYIKAV